MKRSKIRGGFRRRRGSAPAHASTADRRLHSCKFYRGRGKAKRPAKGEERRRLREETKFNRRREWSRSVRFFFDPDLCFLLLFFISFLQPQKRATTTTQHYVSFFKFGVRRRRRRRRRRRKRERKGQLSKDEQKERERGGNRKAALPLKLAPFSFPSR